MDVYSKFKLFKLNKTEPPKSQALALKWMVTFAITNCLYHLTFHNLLQLERLTSMDASTVMENVPLHLKRSKQFFLEWPANNVPFMERHIYIYYRIKV